MSRANALKPAFLAATLLLLLIPLAYAAPLSGTVTDENGSPLPDAHVRVIPRKGPPIDSTADSSGAFTFPEVPPGASIAVYMDDPETPGVDYLPYLEDLRNQSSFDVKMYPGSSIVIEGSVQYIDSDKLSLESLYIVLQPDGEQLNVTGFQLIYGTRSNGISKVFEPLENHLVVPADAQIMLQVNGSFIVGSDVKTRSFNTEPMGTPGKGGAVTLDIRRYSIPSNRQLALDAYAEMEELLAEMNGYGFYISKQEGAASNADRLIENSLSLYGGASYAESYDELKRGFIEVTQTISELNYMYRDARSSVYLLIGFLALASLTTGYLMVEASMTQVLGSLGIFGAAMTVFYYTYPGSKIVTFESLLFSSAISFVVVLVLSTYVPRFLSHGTSDGRVSTRNLLIPIFSIAKRSLRRRRTRFLLTFSSIMLLVMSFVTLTSFSEGYGLIEASTGPRGDWEGVFIRDGAWETSTPTYILFNDVEESWLLSQPEVTVLSAKAENAPYKRPFLRAGGVMLSGVVGFSENEVAIVRIGNTLVSGSLPDEDGLMLSSLLVEAMGLSLGDRVDLGYFDLELQGVFSDERFQRLRDVDGELYLPEKWVNTNPEGESPLWVIQPCLPNEIAVMTLGNARAVPTVGVQRISLSLTEETAPEAFAERLALQRGYLAFSNTGDAFTSYRLGNYFEGRGFTLVIPWAIVVLNVVVTMLNALYERRKEIEILSSVGLNPQQVSAIFVAEATVTGFIAGGAGYLLGLVFYKVMAYLNVGLLVHQKVSAIWSLAAITLAISAVLTGAYAALRNSIVITPSLMRRWKIDRNAGGYQDPWNIVIPIKLQPEEVDHYIDFVHAALVKLKDHPTQVTSSIKLLDTENGRMISFIYKSIQATTGNFFTKNELYVEPISGEEYGARLDSLGDPNWVHVAGSLIRRISMDYSAEEH